MGECIISNFGTESTLSLGASVPATASPRFSRGLPSSTAELRRRIITFYADFNTRLRPIPSPFRRLRLTAATPSPRYGISNRESIRRAISFIRFRTTANSSFLALTSFFFFFPLFSLTPFRTLNHRRCDFFEESIECRPV